MGAAASAAGGIVGGLMGASSGGGQDVGSNIFSLPNDPGAQAAYKNLGQYGLVSNLNGAFQQGIDNTYANSTGQVQNNPILGQLFGPQGTMGRTAQDEQNLASRGYSLQPEDYEAYGQASGNIARMFGQSEQGLAQDLANRGLSNSGVAGQQFSGLFGNKQEQLAQLQTQIAQRRMDMNNQRLAQTRQFLGQLGAQAQGAIGQANDIQGRNAQQRSDMVQGYMGNLQGTNERAFQDRQQTAGGASAFGKFAGGAMAGAGMGGKLFGALSGKGASKTNPYDMWAGSDANSAPTKVLT